MPAKSKSQFRWWYAQYNKGKVSKKQLKEWVGGVSYRSLPEKVSRATDKRSRKKRRKRG